MRPNNIVVRFHVYFAWQNSKQQEERMSVYSILEIPASIHCILAEISSMELN